MYDVIIVGGSYAGLSAAMSLGRSLRKVLVIDSGKPCNAQTPHSHNFLTQDGRTPAEISSIAKSQVLLYETVEFQNDLATKGTKTPDGFEIGLESGRTVRGKKLILATGIIDRLPDIPGFAACWGISAIHCPYCHGYEYHGRKTAVLGNGETAMHYALLVSNLTKELTILSNGKPDFSPEQMEKLNRHHIEVVDLEVDEILHRGGYLHGVVFRDGSKATFDALYLRPPFMQHTDLAGQLGCELDEPGYIRVDAMQKTTVEGMFACGDNSSMMRSVAMAVATGNMAGAAINRELAAERF